jgi:hypothetical protein
MPKVTVFTSNSARHQYLINQLHREFDDIYVISECTSVYPGANTGFFNKSDVMQEYFTKVKQAEHEVFGAPCFQRCDNYISLGVGDINLVPREVLAPALLSDHYIVFGSSFIKGRLGDFLIKKKAINIHMGLSPYYRGSSCNFWAAFDGNIDKIGSTTHLLSSQLDGGPILSQIRGYNAEKYDYFSGSMQLVKQTIDELIANIKGQNLSLSTTLVQDPSRLIRYSKNSDFTDEVARAFLKTQQRK